MANAFSKEEVVLFNEQLEGFEADLVISTNASKFKTNETQMARSGDTVRIPQPYIASTVDGAPGVDISSSFKSITQLSIPVSLSNNPSSPWELNYGEMRDIMREKDYMEAAKQRIAADIDTAIMELIVSQASLVIPRTGAASGFDDVALCDAVMNEQGIGGKDRLMALNSRDYNAMAGNLAARQTLTGKPTTAYERAYIGQVSGFETFKMDGSDRVTAAAGGAGITMDTRDVAVNYWVPKATSVSVGGKINVDNRYQTITVSSTTNVASGDAFTVTGLNSVHHITKKDTGQLKTFRVVSVDSGTTMTITPPMITNQVASDASEQYQNCVINTKAANSAIVFLNVATAQANVFWKKDCLMLLPGTYPVTTNAGIATLKGSTPQGIELRLQKWAVGESNKVRYRLDAFFGVAIVPEFAGLMLFNQV